MMGKDTNHIVQRPAVAGDKETNVVQDPTNPDDGDIEEFVLKDLTQGLELEPEEEEEEDEDEGEVDDIDDDEIN